MKIEITKNVQQVEIIEVELPYYYTNDLMYDHAGIAVCGKIEENVHTCVKETLNYRTGEFSYTIERTGYTTLNKSNLSRYFEQEYVSTKENYEAVKKRCVEFLSNF